MFLELHSSRSQLGSLTLLATLIPRTLSHSRDTETMVDTITLSPTPSSSTAMPSPASSPTPHRMKLDVPQFEGTDPLGWIFKINQFFVYHATPE